MARMTPEDQKRLDIFIANIAEEVYHQHYKWGPEHDDTHKITDWFAIINATLEDLRQQWVEGNDGYFSYGLTRIAAVCASAAMSIDRQLEAQKSAT